jgi:uncharacterized membrane protein YkvA (DUF1232 family)
MHGLKEKAKRLKRDIGALYYACKHEKTPLLVKLLALVVVGYALSPIDLIPDFIPILGYLDDVILLPLGIYIVVKLLPDEILVECREKAEKRFSEDKKANYVVGVIVVVIWIAVIAWILRRIS